MSGAPNRPVAAAFWMIGSIAGFSAVAIAGRALRHHLTTFEVMAWRSLVGLAIVCLVALATGQARQISPRRLDLQLGRNLVHFAGQNLWLFALPLIPLAQLFALEFSYPILVALAAPLVLGERMTPVRALSAAVGFLGVMIVARPFGAGGLSIGLLAALACAFGFAGAALFTKRLTRTVPILSILYWLTFMQMVMGFAIAAFDGQVHAPGAAALPWVLVIGISGLVAHYSLTKALSLAPATVVVPIDFLRLPIIALIGWAFYAEPFDPWVIAGGAIILGANLSNIRADARERQISAIT